MCLDVDGANTSSGTNIQVYEWNGSNAQLFDFEEVKEDEPVPDPAPEPEPEPIEEPEIINNEPAIADGLYKINTKLDSNKYLDINDISTANEANLHIWESTKGLNQKFQITYLNNGYYKIQVKHSGKVLDVASAGTTNGTNVWQYDDNGSDAQQWKIEKLADGKYKIESKCNKLCLDVDGGNPNNGTNVQVYKWNGSNAQIFDFEETEVQAIENGLYEIQMTKDNNMVLEVENGSTK